MISETWKFISGETFQLPYSGMDFVRSTTVKIPCTVASIYHNSSSEFDDLYHYFSNRFVGIGRHILTFYGLTVPSEVWLNGKTILIPESMFVTYEVEVDLVGTNDLLICFKKSSDQPTPKLTRARWRQRLITDSSLRYVRKTMLGHMPGWCPEIHAIGPYRNITCIALESQSILIRNCAINSTVSMPRQVLIDIKIDIASDRTVNADEAFTLIGPYRLPLFADNELTKEGHIRFHCKATLDNVILWYPYTHGTPHRYKISFAFGNETIEYGYIAFRKVELINNCKLIVNDIDIFCRGAVWTTASLVKLPSDKGDNRPSLELFRNSGMNMIRIPGTTLYEDTGFYDLCDEFGIMVWQDFMFANFDYPRNDEFIGVVKTEVTQFLTRIQSFACVVVLCGGSEVYQQAAMQGLIRSRYEHPLFSDILPKIVGECSSAVYFENSPSGGEWPFQTDQGITHYFGVPAYLREFSDIRLSDVKFASECLAVSNIPSPNKIRQMNVPVVHHPNWKRGVPRDNAASWDFEDVRDYYLQAIYKVDPNILRRQDQSRYLDLSRAVSHILITTVFNEWRSYHSNCNGGLVLSYQDVMSGAGWGIIDNDGIPKSAYYAMQSISQQVQVVTTSEGLNGLNITVVNELEYSFDAVIKIECLKDGLQKIAEGSQRIQLKPRDSLHLTSRVIIEGFFDICYAYKFGPPSHNVSVVSLLDMNGAILSQAFDFPLGHVFKQEELNLSASVAQEEGKWFLSVTSEKFAYFLHIDILSYMPKNDWVHLVAGQVWKTELISLGDTSIKPEGFVLAVNSHVTVPVRVII